MTINDVQSKIDSILSHEFGLEAYACLRENDCIVLKRIGLSDALCGILSKMFSELVHNLFFSDTAILDSIDNIDDNRKIYYEIPQSDSYQPFTFLFTKRTGIDYYTEECVDKIIGLSFRFNLNDEALWIYQQISYPQLIKRSKNIYAILSGGNTYTALDKDILKVESKIDCLIWESTIITSKIDLMQRTFGFETYVRQEAQKTIGLISDMGIVDSLDKFIALESKQALTNAKKLLKAKKSPVLRMDSKTLIEKLRVLPRYKDKFVISNNKIVIGSQSSALDFLRMLNDDILKSELTDTEYDSSIKTELDPIPNN